ncbi:MAG: TetR family transcriptional regulator C-terminal domain-containing protein [Paracoccaceae bacterium]|uniref:TetR family transcriptional regulator C-terminal domain-containing protein n=1 Tax=unclassified Seohaeicola TaxID=2641111 RepID=UPI00237B493B|nr:MULTISPECIES: TetR family transcriptional regulator C-terminal domain-containing protein [unclassified Seohaeicola]MDD9705988.1 TetR family transcriptional regulator C-terminal domain-containing protein [Seohaeicola sp. 4SK31]MDD9736276.1 TetR family transcriptional regulator C-terminal domain-containing protein [Seohaeicola sp. SP36]MDM7969653.1 TetR family transcriptional regulator C-terminal domain-containing protein [Paracoccaceae bacterium]
MKDAARTATARAAKVRAEPAPKRSRIQTRNRKRILEAALEVFSAHGFRGATLDQIAAEAGLSKPNILYYFDGKEAIHVTLLNQLMETWLDPLEQMNPEGEPLEEILAYIRRKLDMAQAYPRESRLFANEILQGAPRMGPHLEARLKPLVDQKAALIAGWAEAGRIAAVDPRHLIFSIWATTQHYADFEAQVNVLMPEGGVFPGAASHLETMYRRLLTV